MRLCLNRSLAELPCPQGGHAWSLWTTCRRLPDLLILQGENSVEFGKAFTDDTNTPWWLRHAAHPRQHWPRLWSGKFILNIGHDGREYVIVTGSGSLSRSFSLLDLLSILFLLLDLEQAHILESFEHLLALHLLATLINELLSSFNRHVAHILQTVLPPATVLFILLVFIV